MTPSAITTARTLLASCLLACTTSLAAGQESAGRYDLLIAGGSMLDAAGSPARVLDVGIRGDRIVALAPSLPHEFAARVIDAAGRIVVPAPQELLAAYAAAGPRSGKVNALVPAWAMAGGQAAFRARVLDPALEDSILRGMVDNMLAVPGGSDLSRVQFAHVSWDTNANGKTLRELAECRNLEPTPENGARVVLEALLSGGDSATYSVPGASAAQASENLVRLLASDAAADRRVLRVGDRAAVVVLAPNIETTGARTGERARVETVIVNGEVVGKYPK